MIPALESTSLRLRRQQGSNPSREVVQAIRNLAQMPRFDLILRTRGACREGMRCATRGIIVPHVNPNGWP